MEMDAFVSLSHAPERVPVTISLFCLLTGLLGSLLLLVLLLVDESTHLVMLCLVIASSP